MQNTGVLIAVAAAAYFLFFRKSGPVYRNMQGQVITEITCGQSITFDVPGYSRVWLSQLKNGVLSYDGLYDVPSQPYILACSVDVGQYENAVYEVNANGMKGDLIAQSSFTVLQQAIT